MLQVYTFTGSGSSTQNASTDARNNVNKFLASDEANLIEVTQVLQSESQTCSTYEGMIDWSYSLTVTVIGQLSSKNEVQVWEKYIESIS